VLACAVPNGKVMWCWPFPREADDCTGHNHFLPEGGIGSVCAGSKHVPNPVSGEVHATFFKPYPDAVFVQLLILSSD